MYKAAGLFIKIFIVHKNLGVSIQKKKMLLELPHRSEKKKRSKITFLSFLTAFYWLTLLMSSMHVIPLLCPGCCYSTVSGRLLAAPAVFQLQLDGIRKTGYPVCFSFVHTAMFRDLNNVTPVIFIFIFALNNL